MMKRKEMTKKYDCPYCDKVFTTSIFVFKDHINKNHPGQKVVMKSNGEFVKYEEQSHKERRLQHDHSKQ